MSIKIQVLLSLFATLTSSSGAPPDLCDIAYTDTGRPIFCEPHRDGAPVYDDTVCCDGHSCIPSRQGSCAVETRAPYYCELGEVKATGEVSCYFEVPDYCEAFPCAPGFQSHPQRAFMCCNAGICWNTFTDSNDCEPKDIFWCQDGVTNPDGTMTCFD